LSTLGQKTTLCLHRSVQQSFLDLEFIDRKEAYETSTEIPLDIRNSKSGRHKLHTLTTFFLHHRTRTIWSRQSPNGWRKMARTSTKTHEEKRHKWFLEPGLVGGGRGRRSRVGSGGWCAIGRYRARSRVSRRGVAGRSGIRTRLTVARATVRSSRLSLTIT